MILTKWHRDLIYWIFFEGFYSPSKANIPLRELTLADVHFSKYDTMTEYLTLNQWLEISKPYTKELCFLYKNALIFFLNWKKLAIFVKFL